jgi:hypothetical protein
MRHFELARGPFSRQPHANLLANECFGMQRPASGLNLGSILDRLQCVSPEDKALWGRMNAHQMICHLCDSAMVALGERYASPATSLFQRTIVKWIALDTSLRWMKGFSTRPEIDQFKGGTSPDDFAADQGRLLVLTRRIYSTQIGGASHPIFGPLTQAEWVRWLYRHSDHHLCQFGR